MLIFPAIDLKSGQCVRLLKGDMNQATIFNNNPAAQAKEFEDLGFKFLHVIDLDGAISGTSANENSVKEIFGFFINKDMFVKKIETLKKKFLYYMEHYDEKKLTIDKFETQVIPVQMGTPNLAMEDAITIKRFLKLDPIFELYKTK